MNTIGSGTMLAPGAGASVDLGLGCPTIKVGRSLVRQIGVVEGELPPGGGFPGPALA